ncbi:LysE family translocator [Histidinibacterium lentulum]|uniref:LysE family translocator n=1 Tax=Histidinibacterium lentulum TaxID=2480588 RepID=A0A3N2QTQ3_9RHOB|nr:LysE family translocator [Histidinibacterium lentulum]ROT98606.1 LysE family translocator [Histidinibacterium lentulum]
MTPDLILALTGFAIATTFSPGPNNVMLMASGANFGLRRSVPHMAGIGLGVMSLVAASGAGLARLFDLWDWLRPVLAVAAGLYLLYLAWRIATAAPKLKNSEPAGRPLTLWQAAAFQWVNPKAWAMAVSATTLYLPDRGMGSLAVGVLVFGLVSVPSTLIWTSFGRAVGRWLTSPERLRGFNRVMAGLIVLSLVPIVLG